MNPHTYKTSATFTMTKEDFISYRGEVMRAIKTHRMALMSDGNNLIWIDEQIKKFPEEKKEKSPAGEVSSDTP